jgi:hypothetical protein
MEVERRRRIGAHHALVEHHLDRFVIQVETVIDRVDPGEGLSTTYR